MDDLLNAICTGSVVSVTGGVLLRRPGLNAATRCVLWYGVLLAVAVLAGVRLAPSWHSGSPSLAGDSGWDIRWPGLPVPAMSPRAYGVLVVIWALGAAVLLGRLAWSVQALLALKRRTRPFPDERLAGLAGWHGILSPRRSPRLRLSDQLRTPAVLGLWRPLIVVPTQVLESLTDDELDQVLLHELAHVERRDDWAKLGQSILEALLWFHPGVWYAARGLNLEREVACDDRVIARTRAPKRLARCLTRLVEVRSAAPDFELAPGTIAASRGLALRVERLLDAGRNSSPALSRAALLVAIGLPALAVHAPAALGPFQPAPGTDLDAGTGAHQTAHSSDAAARPDENQAPQPGTARDSVQQSRVASRPRAAGPAPVLSNRARRPQVTPKSGVLVAAHDTAQAGEAAGASAEAYHARSSSAPPVLSALDRTPEVPTGSAPGENDAPRYRAAETEPGNGIVDPAILSSATQPAKGPAAGNPYSAIGSGFARAGKRTASFFTGAGVSIWRGVSKPSR